MKVTNVTLVIYKVNMCGKKYPVETKFNFVSRKQKEVKMSLIKAEITGDLNGSKSD